MMYMRAHGNTVQRGYRAWQSAAISGFIAGWPALLIADRTEGLLALSRVMSLTPFWTGAVGILVMTLSGALYGFLLPRAAADRAGCWLFGLCYGFAIWLLAPGAAMPLFLGGRPVATGMAAAGLMAGCLAYGLVLGVLFPLVLGKLMTTLTKQAKRG